MNDSPDFSLFISQRSSEQPLMMQEQALREQFSGEQPAAMQEQDSREKPSSEQRFIQMQERNGPQKIIGREEDEKTKRK